jgi:hypothetical protein
MTSPRRDKKFGAEVSLSTSTPVSQVFVVGERSMCCTRISHNIPEAQCPVVTPDLFPYPSP